MVQPARSGGLVLKSGVQAFVLGQIGVQDLERHFPLDGSLLGAVHDPHPALSELLVDEKPIPHESADEGIGSFLWILVDNPGSTLSTKYRIRLVR